MNLHCQVAGDGKPIIILHGIFGSSDNWFSIAKGLSTSYKVYTVDQRNHGLSPHDDEFHYHAMVGDLVSFIAQHSIERPIILGHSMGGKVAMKFAIDHAESLSKLIVIDIAPKSYPVHHHQILKGLAAIPINTLKSRTEADNILSQYVTELGVRQFLLKNLARRQGGFKWKINLPIITQNIEVIGQQLENGAFEKPTLFVRGGKSEYIIDSDLPLIRHHFPKADLATIQDAGHWVHAEQPYDFLKVITNFLEPKLSDSLR